MLPTRGFPLRLSRNRVGRRLSSLPRTPLAGPLANNDQAMKALLQAAMKLIQGKPHMELELKTTIPGLDKLVPGLECVQWRDTYVRGLPTNDAPAVNVVGPRTRTARLYCTSCNSCSILRFGNAHDNHHVKWAVNNASKQGLSVRTALDEAELRTWYRLYLKVMRRNAVPPRPLRFFRQLWKDLRPLGHVDLLLAERGENRAATLHSVAESADHVAISPPDHLDIVGGSILLQFGNTVFWAFTGSDARKPALHATDLTLWYGLHSSCKLGYDYFDLGEVAENHPELSQFKAKWGTVLRPMYRYYYPAHSPQNEGRRDTDSSLLMSISTAVWRRLPLKVVALLGDWIFSYL